MLTQLLPERFQTWEVIEKSVTERDSMMRSVIKSGEKNVN